MARLDNTCDPKTTQKQLCKDCPSGQYHFISFFQEARFVEWWDNQIATSARDEPAFECTPPPNEVLGWIHEHSLAALGCPVGEPWDRYGIFSEGMSGKRQQLVFLCVESTGNSRRLQAL